ncbi:MAG TPA: hypothetical protein VGL04_02540 [Sporichthyaceae bacterium]|jgi:hypothetical protein
MNRALFRVVLAVAIAAPALIPAASASAASRPPRGTIQVCSAHVAKVYADGPSARVDDLATFYQSGECTHWKPVLPGSYEVGFAWQPPIHGRPLIQCVVRRQHRKVYKVFNGQGVVKTDVVAHQLTRIDLFDYRG